MSRRAEDVIEKAGVEYSRDVDISGLSTLGIAARAAYLVFPRSTTELTLLVRELVADGIPYRVVGAMSNTMPSSSFCDGVLINLRRLNRKNVAEHTITLECGVRLSLIVRELKRFSLGGLEQLYHIPGTLGGSVCGNAGAHGLEIGDVFLVGEFYDPVADALITIPREDMDFSYRYSRLKREPLLLLSCELVAEQTDPIKVDERIAHLAALRANQPRGVKTLGSTFKRVDGVSAGYYIDRAGLKGFSVGGAEVSRVHAGFIVNRGGATPHDVLSLIHVIKERVFREFGVSLVEEIEFL